MNLQDLLALGAAQGTAASEMGSNSRCDLNQDSAIDIIDVLILAEHWPQG